MYDNAFDRVVVQKPAVLTSFEKVDLPHDFIVGKPRSADAPGVP